MEQEPTPVPEERKTTLEKWCEGKEFSARAKWFVRELLVPCLYPDAVEGEVPMADMRATVDTAMEATEDGREVFHLYD